jgi:hypothetical protein
MMQRWRKVPNPLRESSYAENNVDHFGANLFPIPEAKSDRAGDTVCRRVTRQSRLGPR